MSVQLFILKTMLKLSMYIKLSLKSGLDIDNMTDIQNDIQDVINQLS